MSDPNVLPFPGNPRSQGGSTAQGLVESVFLEQHQRLLTSLTIRLGSAAEAQDAAQATFVRLWQSASKLRNDNLTSLLFVTARNIATDILRSRRSALQKSLVSQDDPRSEGVANVADDSPLADRVIEARQALAIIGRTLEELPLKCRSAFIAYRFDSLGYPEIAERMGVTESMVRKYVLRAAAHCAERFEQLEGWE
jgi:RNA polymerase sigma-70 factor (ECF subfamily)